MKTAMYAIIKKDFRGVASNRRLFSALLIVPLVLTIVLPSIFVIAIHFVPDDPDVAKLLSLLPEAARRYRRQVYDGSGRPAGKPGTYAFQHDLKLYPSGLFPGDSYNGCFYHGSQCICRRKGTPYA